MKQIPREGQAFRDMDNIWRRIMEKVRRGWARVGRGACRKGHVPEGPRVGRGRRVPR